jgi:hypothetical protein
MTTDKDQHNNKSGVNPVVAGVAGVVVGAGVAAAISLKDEKNRQQAKKALDTVKTKAQKYAEEMAAQVKGNPSVREAGKIANEKMDASKEAMKNKM